MSTLRSVTVTKHVVSASCGNYDYEVYSGDSAIDAEAKEAVLDMAIEIVNYFHGQLISDVQKYRDIKYVWEILETNGHID